MVTEDYFLVAADCDDLVAACVAGESIHLDPICEVRVGSVGADGHWTNTVADNYKGPFRCVPYETLLAFGL